MIKKTILPTILSLLLISCAPDSIPFPPGPKGDKGQDGLNQSDSLFKIKSGSRLKTLWESYYFPDGFERHTATGGIYDSLLDIKCDIQYGIPPYYCFPIDHLGYLSNYPKYNGSYLYINKINEYCDVNSVISDNNINYIIYKNNNSTYFLKEENQNHEYYSCINFSQIELNDMYYIDYSQNSKCFQISNNLIIEICDSPQIINNDIFVKGIKIENNLNP